MKLARFAPTRARHSIYSGTSGGIVSSFRLICIAALTAATGAFVVQTAAAQTSPAADQSGKHYLAGLPPPHEHHKTAHAKTPHAGAQRQATAKIAQAPAKRRPAITANAKPHRPARLADKINSHVTWPSVEPEAADEPTTPPTALQFATDDAAKAPVAPPRPAAPAPVTAGAKISPPAKIAATEERDTIDSVSAAQPATANTLVQIERYQAPTVTEALPATTPQGETAHTASHSIGAQLLATLAGAIAAALVGWLMIAFGPARTLRINGD
jgi:hypothetical protein